MQTIVECVPNFSEGRDSRVIDAIVEAILAGPDAHLLRREMDADHNRCVITFVGTLETVGEAALRGIGKAAELIDLNKHQGVHPRLGATDVVPFIPISGVTLADCVRVAEWVAEEAWRRFKIPTYLYEAAARRPDRVNLENVRRGQFEGMREEIRTNPDRRPDFGEPALHPTAGATVVGARKVLIAYNINLNTPDLEPSKAIAKKIRASSGGFPCVKAMGVKLQGRGLTQVSMNLTDFETTSMANVYEAVTLEAAALGVQVVGSEIVGLVPRKALESVAVHFLRVENFRPELIVENRLEEVLQKEALATSESGASGPLGRLVQEYVDKISAPTPTPGGGSAAALAGALAAGLAEMVAGVSLKRKSLTANRATLEASIARMSKVRERFLELVDLDPKSYEALMVAFRLPKDSAEQSQTRDAAIQEASKLASLMPLETAELATAVEKEIAGLKNVTTPQAASDLFVAENLAEAARKGGIENINANLPLVHDDVWLQEVNVRLEAVQKGWRQGSVNMGIV